MQKDCKGVSVYSRRQDILFLLPTGVTQNGVDCMYKIMLVGDDGTIQNTYSDMEVWERCGFQITTRTDFGSFALNETDKENPDIIFAVNPLNQEDLEPMLMQLKEMLDTREEGTDMQKILAQIIPEKSALSDILIRNVVHRLETNMQHNLSIEEIAESLHMNKDYLGKQIKKKTGLPFRILNNRVKVEYAKKLIKNGRYKIYQISEMLGYASPDYFARIFKNEVKITPAEYKTRCESDF